MIKSRLRILLTEKGLTQRKLSELTGVRPATITGIVNNSIKQIPVDSVSKICKALNCDVGDLFYYEPEQITTPKVNASDLTKRSVSSSGEIFSSSAEMFRSVTCTYSPSFSALI